MKGKMGPWRRSVERIATPRGENPFDALHREMNELFDLYYRGGRLMDRRIMGSAGFEMSETDDEIRVKVELPGMDEKDIEVSLEENVLTIRGERKEQRETKKRDYHVSEMSCGGYQRSIALPAQVDHEKTKAKFKRGVLTLTLPKTAKAKADRKRITIEGG